MQALGYISDIGYNSFLYTNEAECRSLLMWLIEKLPKVLLEHLCSRIISHSHIFHTLQTTDGSGGDETSGPNSVFYASVASEMSRRLKMSWAPPVRCISLRTNPFCSVLSM